MAAMQNIRTFERITSTNDLMRTKLRWPDRHS
jgi:hypothetical protein